MNSFEDKFMPYEVENEVLLNSFFKGYRLVSGSNSNRFWDLGPWLIALSFLLTFKNVSE